MYVLVVYDTKVERVNKVNKFLKTYLHWQQNSVFEGKLTKSQYTALLSELHDLIDEEEDSIIIYKFPEKYMDKKILGLEKNPIEFII